jgi:rubrerythrin
LHANQPKVIDAINEQIGYEFSAELQYYAIAALFAAEALPQLSQHFFQQAEEEKGYAAALHQARGRFRRTSGNPGNRCAKIEIQDGQGIHSAVTTLHIFKIRI